MNRELKAALRRTLPVAASYLLLGFGFGVLLVSRGYAFIWAPLMSLFIYAGAMQYVTIDLLVSGASPLAAAAMTLLINARHLFYGISMLEKYQDMGRAKPYLIFSLTDETYTLLCYQDTPEGLNIKHYYLLVSLINQAYWVLGTTLGALTGSLLPIDFKGIEFSMTALFAVIFLEQWLKQRDNLPAVLGLGTALVCLMVFGPERFVLPAMALMLVFLLGLRGRLDREGEA